MVVVVVGAIVVVVVVDVEVDVVVVVGTVDVVVVVGTVDVVVVVGTVDVVVVVGTRSSSAPWSTRLGTVDVVDVLDVVEVVVGGTVVDVVDVVVDVVDVVVVVGGGQTTRTVCVANAPATSGGVNCGYASAICTRSRNTELQSAGSFGIVTPNVAVHGVSGASVSPSLITVVSASVQSISTGAPLPGLPLEMNGAVSASDVTVAGNAPVLVSTEVHCTVSPIVYGSPGGAGGHSFDAEAPV